MKTKLLAALRYLRDRLAEPSTRIALVTLAGAVGVSVSEPAYTVGLALLGLVCVVLAPEGTPE